MSYYVNPHIFLGMPEEIQQNVRDKYARPEIYKQYQILVDSFMVFRQYLQELPERAHVVTDLDTLYQVVADYLKFPSELSSDLMLKYPLLYTGSEVSLEELIRLLHASDRPQPLVLIRHVIWYVLRDYQGYQLVTIARAVERDHATVISGIEKVKNSLAIYRGNCEMSKLLKFILTKKLPTTNYHTSLVKLRENHQTFVDLLVKQREFYRRRIIASVYIYHLLKRTVQVTDAEYRLMSNISLSKDIDTNIDFVYLCNQFGIKI